jgi:uncharacterized membrane protein
MTTRESAELFKPDRLLAFSDGVFGVAITLLVIDLRLPPIPPGDESALLQALLGMEQNLFVFVFTFIIVGMSWLGHHRKFSYIDKVDGRLLWLNLLYLLALCLVPFVSSVLAEHGGSRLAFTLYAGVMALTDILSAGLSSYGLREPFLEGKLDPRPGLRRDMVLSPLFAGMLFIIAAVIASGGLLRLARWTLILIVPAMAFFGSRTRPRSSARKS